MNKHLKIILDFIIHIHTHKYLFSSFIEKGRGALKKKVD